MGGVAHHLGVKGGRGWSGMSSTEREGVGGIENTILNLVFFKKIPLRGVKGDFGLKGGRGWSDMSSTKRGSESKQ